MLTQISKNETTEKTNINRAMISKIESMKYMPSIEQLESLEEVLNFTIDDVLEEKRIIVKDKNITRIALYFDLKVN